MAETNMLEKEKKPIRGHHVGTQQEHLGRSEDNTRLLGLKEGDNG